MNGSSFEPASARSSARLVRRPQRRPDRVARQPRPADQLLDRDAAHKVLPARLGPLLHIDQPLHRPRLDHPDRARIRIHPDASARGVRFQPAEGVSFHPAPTHADPVHGSGGRPSAVNWGGGSAWREPGTWRRRRRSSRSPRALPLPHRCALAAPQITFGQDEKQQQELGRGLARRALPHRARSDSAGGTGASERLTRSPCTAAATRCFAGTP